MASIDAGDLRRTLQRKVGATEDTQRRHIFYKIRVGGVLVRTTMLSHGAAGQIGQPLLGQIARQLGISSQELVELVSCTMTSDRYFEIIEAAGG
jgi:hypothetical protein